MLLLVTTCAVRKNLTCLFQSVANDRILLLCSVVTAAANCYTF